MNTARTHPSGDPLSRARFARSLALLVGLVTLARLVYLAFFCPYTLVGDEAHYWEWSRRLDLSYYTKGPGIAWTIAAGVRMFGDTEFGVRVFAPLAGGVLAAVTALLAADVTRDRRAGLYAAGCVLVAPIFQSLALLMTIDGPYAALWALACWSAWRACAPESGSAARAWGWAGLGLAAGVGCLYKYTALLTIPGPVIYWVLWRRVLGRRGPHPLGGLMGVALLLAATLPITVWNVREGWPTIRHLLGHLRVAGGDNAVEQGGGHGWHYSPLWTINFLAGQVGLVGPVLLIALAAAWRSWRTRRADAERWRREAFLLVTGVPILVFYVLVSAFRQPEGNWPLAGYITLFGLAGARLSAAMPAWADRVRAWRALPAPRPRAGLFRRRPETFTQVCWHVALWIGIGAALATTRMDLVKRVPLVGPLLPLHRFTGADAMAAHAQRLMDRIRVESGREPFLLSTHYGRASQMAFYMPGHPRVYCCQGSMPDGRTTQYDYFADTNLRSASVAGTLAGRPALVLEVWPHHDFSSVFESMTPLEKLDGSGPHGRPATFARGFRGFPAGLLPERQPPNDAASPPLSPLSPPSPLALPSAAPSSAPPPRDVNNGGS